MTTIARVFAADWSKARARRSVYVASVRDRVVRRVAEDVHDVASLLAHARGAPTLVAFDAPLGLPESFLVASGHAGGFLRWLDDRSLDSCENAASWSLSAPFFRVPAGKGALGAFEAAARRRGASLRRQIEVRTGAKPVFVTSGIPGSVGSAALDVWRGLQDARRAGVAFRVWPFEGPIDARLATPGCPVVGEVYPRAAYATALVDDAPRARLAVAKSDPAVRAAALARLGRSRWVRDRAVTIADLGPARASEDDFDALVTATALLRCLIEDLPLFASPLHAPSVEGGILGTGTVDLALPETRFTARRRGRGS